jgi:hypothetical protein
VAPFVYRFADPIDVIKQVRIGDAMIYRNVKCIRQKQIVQFKVDLIDFPEI